MSRSITRTGTPRNHLLDEVRHTVFLGPRRTGNVPRVGDHVVGRRYAANHLLKLQDILPRQSRVQLRLVVAGHLLDDVEFLDQGIQEDPAVQDHQCQLSVV